MSDIRFNRWLHQSGTGGVYQASSGNVGIGTSVPSTTLDVNGAISATSITATTGTITGNLSVGGVLTYEDVTNIDAVGVVTARAGVKIPDSQKIFLGTGDDLQIYHDGNHSRIVDSGTGNLVIQSNRVDIQDAAGAENIAIFQSDGSVDLFHNNVKKFETTSNGIQISGDQVLNGHLDMRDSDRIRLGASDDLQIFHNGSANYIDNTSDLYVRVNGSETAIYATANGKVALNYDGSNRLETTSAGLIINEGTDKTINFTGSIGEIGNVTGFQATNTAGSALVDFGMRATTLRFATGSAERLRIDSNGSIRVVGDNQKLTLGAGNDFELYHDGSDNVIATDYPNIRIGTTGETFAKFDNNGAVELYYDNTKRFETKSNGTQTTGRIYINGTNGGFDYNNIAHTLEFLVSNGSTHSELTHNAYVPSASGTRHLGYANKRWDTLYVDKIAFGGSANTSQHSLDDYEEGTWSPNVGGNASYDIQWGYYVKVGSLVQCWGGLRTQPLGTGDAKAINNLPFTAVASPSSTLTGGGSIVWHDNAPVNIINTPAIAVTPNTTNTRINAKTSGSGILQDSANFWQNNHRAKFFITYYTTV